MDENLIEAIERTRKSIRKKYKDLQQWKGAEKRSFERIYEPLISPLKHMSKKEIQVIKKEEERDENGKKEEPDITIDESTPQESHQSNSSQEISEQKEDELDSSQSDLFSDAQNNSLREFWLNEMIVSPLYDSTYGPKYVDGELKWGDKKFDISNEQSKIITGEYAAPATEGILQLIFYKQPNDSVIVPNDLKAYNALLNYTSAHRLNCDPLQRINGNSGKKYLTYIQPFLEKAKKSGGNLKFFVSNKKTTYKYWDDPNELLKRLSLLVADKNAGNKTAHDVEIDSILSELFQKKYIEKISKR